ncbi:MAG: hypothetical protein QG656_797 [Candidatus Hydrogenedentes bacterium]|nr:hypothetical protein [Candidatus Hydrogenedentota bacterium]
MLLLAPAAVLLIGVNLWSDPAGLFRQRQEREIVQHLLEGKNVANVHNHDDRQNLRYFVAGLNTPKDVLVFGSSRLMVIDSSFFPGETLFNASVAAGTLRDLVADYQLFHEKGLIPKRIFIGVEPYMLNGGYSNKMYLRAEYHRGLDRLGLEEQDDLPILARFIDRRYAQLLSPTYFQVSLAFASGIIKNGRPEPYVTTEFEVDEQMIRADGSLSYGLSRRALSRAEVEDKAFRFVSKHPEELANFRRLDPRLTRIFEVFTESLLAEGVQPVFIMAPYHPVSYRLMMENDTYRIAGEVQRYYEDFAVAHGIPVYGSYDPAACGFTADDFYDAAHCSREALVRLFQAGPASLPR